MTNNVSFGSVRLVPFLLAGAAACTCAFLCWHVLGLIPHIPDETSYVFQARIFASGKLWQQAPAVPETFRVDHIVILDNRWFSIYPPGWPMLLAIGWWIGAPWLINPLLVGVSVLGIWRLASSLYDQRVAIVSCLLFLASPFVLLMGAGFMSHPAAMCASIWCVERIVAATTADRPQRFFSALLLAGIAFLIRPLTAVLLLWPVILWSLWIQRERLHFAGMWIFSGPACMILVFLLYNFLIFGNPLCFGYQYDPAWKDVHYSFRFLPQNFIWYFQTLNKRLWGCPWPDLLIFVPLLIPKWRRKTDLLLAASVLSLLLGYCMFSWKDVVYSGPRYIFEAMGFLAILAARSVICMTKRLHTRILWILPIAVLVAFPLLGSLRQQIEYHSQIYHGQSREFLDAVDSAGVGKEALVLLAGDPYVLRTFFFENALDPSTGGRVFLYDVPGRESEIRREYPRPEIWRVTIRLAPLPGPNSYTDRWKWKDFDCRRLRE